MDSDLSEAGAGTGTERYAAASESSESTGPPQPSDCQSALLQVPLGNPAQWRKGVERPTLLALRCRVALWQPCSRAGEKSAGGLGDLAAAPLHVVGKDEESLSPCC